VIPIKPIIKISATHQVVDRIKNCIETGEYKIGEKLQSEKELCLQLQVGRSTIREAFRILQALEYIEVIHGKGAFVAKTPLQNNHRVEHWFEQNKYDLVDIMDVRLAVESVAVKNTIQHISEDEMQKLTEIQDAYSKAVIQSDVNQIALYDEYFHAYLVSCSHNPLLDSLNQSIAEALRAYRLNAYSIASNRFHGIGPHQEIVDALRSRNFERANAAVIKHIAISVEDMKNVMLEKVVPSKK
jgi:GntR family transcriptional repressor for pyruvate dehydrogenase complex